MAYKFRRSRVKDENKTQLDFPKQESPLTTLEFNGAKRTVSDIVVISKHNTVVVGSHDNYVRIYSFGSKDDNIRIFAEHTDQVRGIELLVDDIVVSVGDDRSVRTWHANTAEEINCVFLESWALSVYRIDKNRFAVGTADGELAIFWHNFGRDLKKVQSMMRTSSDWVFELKVHRDVAVFCSHNKSVSVWNIKSKKQMAILEHEDWVKSIAVNEKYIVAACHNGKIYMYKHTGRSITQIKKININRRLQSIEFIQNNLLCIGGYCGSFLVIDIVGNRVACDLSLNNKKPLWCCTVTRDGRIAFGEKDGRSAIALPPENIREVLETKSFDSSIEETYNPPETNEIENEVEVQSVVNKNSGSSSQSLLPSENESLKLSTNSNELNQKIDLVQKVGEFAWVDSACMHLELNSWARKGLGCTMISSLSSFEVASAIAAYLVNYDAFRSTIYSKMKIVLQNLFEYNLLDGTVIANILKNKSNLGRSRLQESILTELRKTNTVGERLGLEFRLEYLMDTISERSLESGKGNYIINRLRYRRVSH